MYDLDNGTEDIKVNSVETNNIVSSDEIIFTSSDYGSFYLNDEGFVFNAPNGIHINASALYFAFYTTALRPTGIGEGAVIYDITLKKCILYNGTAWVNLDGTSLGE